MITLLLPLLACTAPSGGGGDTSGSEDTGTGAADVPWADERPALAVDTLGQRSWKRGIIHLHSHYSHDACDGEPIVDGVPREDCLADLRYGLCATGMDFAYVTDHPAHFAEQAWEDVLLVRHADEVVDGIANRMSCADSTGSGQTVLLMPGVEDELMPIGLTQQVAADPQAASDLYNGTGPDTFAAEQDAGALVMQAHTEGKSLDDLLQRQAWGLTGVEMFNLHAMFDPTKREEDLGLDAYGYIGEIAPFLTGENGAEPDLAFLAVYQEQAVSVARWDALNEVAGMTGIAGTDAHENVLPSPAADGERFDSYRRMMSWFSNILLVRGDGPEDFDEAVSGRHAFVAFESLGTPADWIVSYGELEMGGDAALGETLTVSCPTLAADSPQVGEAPAVRVVVFKDGEAWQEGCGSWSLTEAGNYRAVAYITPTHLAAFLGDSAATLVHEYPWLYSNVFRVGR